MSTKRAAISIIVLFISLIFLLEPVFGAKNSDPLVRVTIGTRKIINHNIQRAKQTAVSDALEIAVQNAFVLLVSNQNLASNLDFLYETVLSHTSDYIQTYKVVGGIETNNHYVVGVESKVDIALLEKTLTDARIINVSQSKPVILFFIVEKTPTDLLSKYWWGNNPIPYQSIAETVIIDKMLQDEFVIKGGGQQRPDPSLYKISFDSIYDVEAAKALGRKMQADMIIFGNAIASETTNRMGEEKTFSGEINLAGYNLKTGEKVIESNTSAAAKSNVEQTGNIQALTSAANLSAVDLTDKIDTYWQENLKKEHTFDVNIEGANFLSRFLALKKKLKEIPGIENMQPREMGSDYAVLQIFYNGKASQFADTVMLKTFDSFGLEISDVRNDFINIRFIDKE